MVSPEGKTRLSHVPPALLVASKLCYTALKWEDGTRRKLLSVPFVSNSVKHQWESFAHFLPSASGGVNRVREASLFQYVQYSSVCEYMCSHSVLLQVFFPAKKEKTLARFLSKYLDLNFWYSTLILTIIRPLDLDTVAIQGMNPNEFDCAPQDAPTVENTSNCQISMNFHVDICSSGWTLVIFLPYLKFPLACKTLRTAGGCYCIYCMCFCFFLLLQMIHYSYKKFYGWMLIFHNSAFHCTHK